MWPRLEARLEPSNVMRYASPLLAVALTLAGGIVVFAALGKNPVEGFRVFFVSPLKDVYGVAELLLKATPLMLIAVGLAVGFRANVWNIGAEGQYILGAVASGGVALHYSGGASIVLLPASPPIPALLTNAAIRVISRFHSSTHASQCGCRRKAMRRSDSGRWT